MKTIQTNPTARIAVKRNVLKQYRVDNADVVYLKKDSEFEIELFNPLQEPILAEISLNNKEIAGGGLILRPGERIFLERYLTEDKKFKFDVYQVDNSEAVQQAIANNGLVTIKFYREKRDLQIRTPWATTTWYNTSTPFYGGGLTATYGSGVSTLTRSGGDTSKCIASNAALFSSCAAIDTGIIAKGDVSHQKLIEVDQDFHEYPFTTVNIKILPDTQQVFSNEDIKYRKYCSECGSKLKPTDKFCSNCGSKI